ncbi:oxygenase MpaB family protein [Actinokineospora guangxiensis]|uniref:Oxygenase MpaB family protein n=1 Tax=Actinokineospora guangxiensis TaxID=1490288 RepID=A0ABW0EQR2_9PSEU
MRSAPLGPGSLTWHHFGDSRGLLFLGRIGTLQNMHPAVGAALREHSDFFDNPLDRLFRSMPPILGVVYDPPGSDTGARVRGYHTGLKGHDSRGRRYHALNPDVFWWTHATFVEGIMAVNEFFGTPLTAEEKDRLVAEGVTWWRRYGLTDRPAIDNYPDFAAYWQRMLAEELESNSTTDYAVTMVQARIPPPGFLPAPVWALVRYPVVRFMTWLSAGLMPERAREILGLTWTAGDQRRLAAVAAVVRWTWPKLPRRLRYLDRAYRNMRRVDHGRWWAV